MDAERWRKVSSLYHAVRDRPGHEHAAFLRNACAADPALRREVDSLLVYEPAAVQFLEHPPKHVDREAQHREDDPMPIPSGQRLGAYEVLDRIGVGGMGEVYRAHDLTLQRTVALKLLPLDRTCDLVRVSRFQREARAASSLNHPNVCTIHALGDTPEGQHFIAMEYVQGETLRARLGRGQLAPAEARDIAMQVASALTAAHAAGIVHRDLKPENVMIRSDGLVKVVDFGVAKLAPSSASAGASTSGNLRSTDAGMVPGTLPYMSPEQARGEEVDVRTDIWAVGVMLYEMIAGRSPFPGQSRSDLVESIVAREPEPMAQLPDSTDWRLPGIVGRALQKKRELRYQRMTDLLFDLQALREEPGRPINPAADADPPLAATRALRVPPATVGATASRSRVSRVENRAWRTRAGATLVVSALAVVIGGMWWGGPSRWRARSLPTTNTSAFDAYLRGVWQLRRRPTPMSEQSLVAATEELETAVAQDPRFALARATLASAYTQRFFYNVGDPSFEQKAFLEIERALAINPDQAEAYLARAQLSWNLRNGFPHEGAIIDLRRALSLNPNLAEAYVELAKIYYHIGLTEKSLDAGQQAFRLDPTIVGPGNRPLRALIDAGRLDEVRQELARDDPGLAAYAHADALIALGRLDEALAVLLPFQSVDGGNPEPDIGATALLGVVYARLGRRADAERIIAVVIPRAMNPTALSHIHHAQYHIGCTLGLLGRYDEAVRWLTRAADEGYPSYPRFMTDHSLQPLRARPDFDALVARLKKHWEQWQTTM